MALIIRRYLPRPTPTQPAAPHTRRIIPIAPLIPEVPPPHHPPYRDEPPSDAPEGWWRLPRTRPLTNPPPPVPIPGTARRMAQRPRASELAPEGEGWWRTRRNRAIEPLIVPPGIVSTIQPRPRRQEEQDESWPWWHLSRTRYTKYLARSPDPLYVTKLIGLATITTPPGLAVAKMVGLATITTPPGLAVAKTLGLAVIAPPQGDSVSKLLGLVVVEPAVSCGPIPVFPSVPQGFPVKIRPTLMTTVGTASSGREVRFYQQAAALWEFELLLYQLRDQTQNQTAYQPFVGYAEFMTACQEFLQMSGAFGLFYFNAPWDNSRYREIIGYGDGQTTTFTILRNWGYEASGVYLPEPIGGINTVTEVRVHGVLIDPSRYNVVGNQITFNFAPVYGRTIKMTYSFYYLCRFLDDQMDFEEFMKNRWMVRSLKMRSVIWPAVNSFSGVSPPGLTSVKIKSIGTGARIEASAVASAVMGETGSVSVWIKVPSGTAGGTYGAEIFSSPNSPSSALINFIAATSGAAGPVLQGKFDDAADATKLEFKTATGATGARDGADGVWNLWQVSWNASSGVVTIAVNGVSQTVTASSDQTPVIAWGSTLSVLGFGYTVYASDFWLSTEFIDFTNANNVGLFLDGDGYATYLGPNGTLGSPTGRQPEFFLHVDQNAADGTAFLTNLGTAGNMVLVDQTTTLTLEPPPNQAGSP